MDAVKIIGLVIVGLFALTIVAGLGYMYISGLFTETTPIGRTTEPSIEKETPKEETQPVEPECIPDWQCSSWIECQPSNTQTRVCTDLNNCGVTAGKPSETQDCVKVYTIGDTIEKSGLKITLSNIRTDYHIGTYSTYSGEYQYEAKDGHKYYIISLTVENIGTKSEYVLVGDLILLDNDKNQYDYSSATYSLTNKFEGKDLLTGRRNSGEVAFEIPESAIISKLYYEIDSYYDIYAIWDLSNRTFSIQSPKECGNTGQVCCDNQCSRENICISGTCVACGKDNQPPCTDGCYFGYELINGVCLEKCSYGEIRIGGVCTDCGGLDEPCCSGNECNYGKICKNNVCVNCGDAGQPCCANEYKCLSYPSSTCVNGICEYCGREGEQCCDDNECNAGHICKNNVCEECGGIGQQCCSPDNPWICFIGDCIGNICVW